MTAKKFVLIKNAKLHDLKWDENWNGTISAEFLVSAGIHILTYKRKLFTPSTFVCNLTRASICYFLLLRFFFANKFAPKCRQCAEKYAMFVQFECEQFACLWCYEVWWEAKWVEGWHFCCLTKFRFFLFNFFCISFIILLQLNFFC